MKHPAVPMYKAYQKALVNHWVMPDWELLPEWLKEAWRQAAKARKEESEDE